MKTKPFALSKMRIAKLRTMLPRTKAPIDFSALANRLNMAGDRYAIVARHLGCKARRETWDRSLANASYARASMAEFDQLTLKEARVWANRVERMDRALFQLATDVAESWLELTGKPIPKLPVMKREKTIVQRAAANKGHPVAFLVNAPGIYLSINSIAEIVRYGRTRAARPELKGVALK